MPADPRTQDLSPQGLTNQLFDAASRQTTDPREAARRVIAFLTEALFYAVTSAKLDVIVFLTETIIYVASSMVDDEASRKELLKHIGDTITNAPPLPANKPEAGKP